MTDDGCIMDEDGFGHFVKDSKKMIYDDLYFYITEKEIEELKEKYDGILWYNK